MHQLRYWLAFGTTRQRAGQAQGHSYLHSVVPWIVLLIAISAGVFLRALGRALGGRCSLPRYTLSFAALWLVCAACLVAIYVCQEFLEGLFATGHPGGLVGIFGYGGWWSVPAALAVGLVLAGGLHGLVGCFGRWPSGIGVRLVLHAVGSPQRARLVSWSCRGWSRWRMAGRTADLLASAAS